MIVEAVPCARRFAVWQIIEYFGESLCYVNSVCRLKGIGKIGSPRNSCICVTVGKRKRFFCCKVRFIGKNRRNALAEAFTDRVFISVYGYIKKLFNRVSIESVNVCLIVKPTRFIGSFHIGITLHALALFALIYFFI